MVLLSFLSRRTAKVSTAGATTLSSLTKTTTRSLSSNSTTTTTTSSTARTPSWATMDPRALGSTAEPYAVQNLCQGQWWSDTTLTTAARLSIPHPLDRDGHPLFTVPDTSLAEIAPFIESLRQCPKTGLHNPLKNPERYLEYGEISRKVGVCLCMCVHVHVCACPTCCLTPGMVLMSYSNRLCVCCVCARAHWFRPETHFANPTWRIFSVAPFRPACPNRTHRPPVKSRSRPPFSTISVGTMSDAWHNPLVCRAITTAK